MWQRDIGSRRRSPERLDADLPERMLADVCRRTGVALIELLAPLRGAAKSADPLYYPLNLHWTAAGNRVAAEAVLEHFGLAPAGLLRRARS